RPDPRHPQGARARGARPAGRHRRRGDQRGLRLRGARVEEGPRGRRRLVRGAGEPQRGRHRPRPPARRLRCPAHDHPAARTGAPWRPLRTPDDVRRWGYGQRDDHRTPGLSSLESGEAAGDEAPGGRIPGSIQMLGRIIRVFLVAFGVMLALTIVWFLSGVLNSPILRVLVGAVLFLVVASLGIGYFRQVGNPPPPDPE